jgi:hypothetical protein
MEHSELLEKYAAQRLLQIEMFTISQMRGSPLGVQGLHAPLGHTQKIK